MGLKRWKIGRKQARLRTGLNQDEREFREKRERATLRVCAAISYLWRRAKALNGHHGQARETRTGLQVMVVEPHFSIPVIPINNAPMY